jgi:hypothetical protein
VVDFLISYDLFQRLTGFTSRDWDLYCIDSPGIQATSTIEHADSQNRDVESEISIRNHIQNAHMVWPADSVGVLAWQNKNMPLDLPKWFKPVVKARDNETARAILEQVRETAESDMDRVVEILIATPEKPELAYKIAKQERDEARRRERAIEGCLDAIRAAEQLEFKADLIKALHVHGLADAEINYAAFLRLTTFGPEHAGESGTYELRKDGARVMGIGPGAGFPPAHAWYTAANMQAVADHQCSALLTLPTKARLLVLWIFEQAGMVQLAIPDSKEYSIEPSRWAEAVSKLVGLKVQANNRANQSSGTRDDYMTLELQSILKDGPLVPKAVMGILKSHVGESGSCVIEDTSKGVRWRSGDGVERVMDVEGLRKRLGRLNKKPPIRR